MRHAVFAHGDFNLHAGIVNLAQDLLDAPHWLAVQGRWLRQFNDNDLTRFGRARRSFGNQYVLPIAFIFRDDNPDTAFLQQAADDGLIRSLDYFNHAPLRSTLAITAHDANLDAVLVQHGAHFVGWQIDVGAAVIA